MRTKFLLLLASLLNLEVHLDADARSRIEIYELQVQLLHGRSKDALAGTHGETLSMPEFGAGMCLLRISDGQAARMRLVLKE